MGDENDGCECIWSHEFLMRRLLEFIRQQQNSCTDTECFVGTSDHTQNSIPNDGAFTSNTIGIVFLILAMVMYFIRPEPIFNLTKSARRVKGPDSNGDSPPPPPPPAPPAVN